MTLDELSPLDLRRERLGRQLEGRLLTHRDFEQETRAAEAEDRAERIARAARRAAAIYRGRA